MAILKNRKPRFLRSKTLTLTGLGALTLLSACANLGHSKPDTKLYIFDCGDIEARDVSMFSPGVDQGQVKQLANSCYLIEHPKGKLLWDTGLNDGIGSEGVEVWNGAFHLSVKNPLEKQLLEIGVQAEDIDYVGISHFHGDHIGNANLFKHSQFLIQEEEFSAAFGESPDKYGFDASLYNQLDKAKIKALKGDHDVFGDGQVVIKRAIGHTPGHQVLFIDLESTGPLVLSGDLYHFTKNREFKRVPGFNFSKPQTLEAIDEIEAFIKEKNATLWIQHDLEQNEVLLHSPRFYQ